MIKHKGDFIMAHENLGFGTMAIHVSYRENAFGAPAPLILQHLLLYLNLLSKVEQGFQVLRMDICIHVWAFLL